MRFYPQGKTSVFINLLQPLCRRAFMSHVVICSVFVQNSGYILVRKGGKAPIAGPEPEERPCRPGGQQCRPYGDLHTMSRRFFPCMRRRQPGPCRRYRNAREETRLRAHRSRERLSIPYLQNEARYGHVRSASRGNQAELVNLAPRIGKLMSYH